MTRKPFNPDPKKIINYQHKNKKKPNAIAFCNDNVDAKPQRTNRT